MAAPRMRPHMVGGLYRIMGLEEDVDSGDADASSPAEYCSLSECIVTPDSARCDDGSSADMVGAGGFAIGVAQCSARKRVGKGRGGVGGGKGGCCCCCLRILDSGITASYTELPDDQQSHDMHDGWGSGNCIWGKSQCMQLTN
jgi:hypothetical protein